MSNPNESIQEGIDEAEGLAEEALAASGEETPPAEKPETVPVAVVAAVRERARTAEQRVAFLEGQAATQQTAPKPEQSPIEAAVTTQGVESVEDVQIDGKLFLAQKKYDEAQTAAKRELETADKMTETQRLATTQAQTTMTDDQLGVGLGAETIIGMGQKYLTKGDQLDVQNAGADCIQVAYDQCLYRIREKGTNQEKELLEQRITAHAAKEADGNAEPEPKPDEIPNQEDALTGDPAVDRLLAGIEKG